MQKAAATLEPQSISEAIFNTECAICLCHIFQSGHSICAIQQNCDHLFCGECLAQWRLGPKDGQVRIQYQCPYCRTESKMVIFWCALMPNFSGEAKQELFELHSSDCIGTVVDMMIWAAFQNISIQTALLQGDL